MSGLPGKVARDIHTTSTKSVDGRVQGRIEDFVVITGFSGAGKSQAMACFEDAGYFCVDNLPPEMIRSLADLFDHEGSQVERAAVVCDVRGGDYFDGLVRVLDEPRQPTACLPRCCSSRRARTCCSTATRRPAGATRWPTAARWRRHRRRAASCSSPLKERADVSIDTTDMTAEPAAQGGGRQDAPARARRAGWP